MFYKSSDCSGSVQAYQAEKVTDACFPMKSGDNDVANSYQYKFSNNEVLPSCIGLTRIEYSDSDCKDPIPDGTKTLTFDAASCVASSGDSVYGSATAMCSTSAPSNSGTVTTT